MQHEKIVEPTQTWNINPNNQRYYLRFSVNRRTSVMFDESTKRFLTRRLKESMTHNKIIGPIRFSDMHGILMRHPDLEVRTSEYTEKINKEEN